MLAAIVFDKVIFLKLIRGEKKNAYGFGTSWTE
jgi:hypothetical protein